MKEAIFRTPGSVSSASLKHYVGYSYPTTGGDRSPALIPENTLREYLSFPRLPRL